jgi:hypothetical protein
MIVVHYEHMSAGNAAAIFPDMKVASSARKQIEELNGNVPVQWDIVESDAPLDDLISDQIKWLLGDEVDSRHCRTGHMEDLGALWSGRAA